MGRDKVLLRNDGETRLSLDPGEEVPAILLFDPQVGEENVVHYHPREESDPDEEVRSARYDQKAAYLTFDALERQVVAAVRAEEFEVAAETAAALFLVQAELGEDWLDDYHSISEEFEVEEEQIGAAMEAVYEWAVENDAGVRDWFER